MIKLRVILYIFVLIKLCLSSYTPSTVPNPNLNPSLCGRGNVPKSNICDPKLYLSEDTKNVIEGH